MLVKWIYFAHKVVHLHSHSHKDPIHQNASKQTMESKGKAIPVQA